MVVASVATEETVHRMHLAQIISRGLDSIPFWAHGVQGSETSRPIPETRRWAAV